MDTGADSLFAALELGGEAGASDVHLESLQPDVSGVIMDPSFLRYALTEAERFAFNEEGLLRCRGCVNGGADAGVREGLRQNRWGVREERGVGPHVRVTVRDVRWRDPSLLDLIDPQRGSSRCGS